MAGDWIKMRCNLDTDPAVMKIAHTLNKPKLLIVGILWKVWAWADQHTVSGYDMGVTTADLDELSGCSGFAKAMREAGWLEGRDGALTFPHFDRHNGQTAKNRSLSRDRMQKKRYGDSVTTASPEKRRVEKKKEIPPTPQGAGGGGEIAEGIYGLYPRKTKDRRKALDAIEAALTKVAPDILREAVTRFAKKPGLDRENGRFIPSAVNWFADECWKDYLPKPAAPVVHVPQPSKALTDLRWVFGRSKQMTLQEENLAHGYIEKLTEEDQVFLTQPEKNRIESLVPNRMSSAPTTNGHRRITACSLNSAVK